MTLSSGLFTAEGPGKKLLERCEAAHDGHFFRGMPSKPGLSDAVTRIQQALAKLGFQVSDPAGSYGKSTAEMVLKFKGPPRNILGPGQVKPDNIVGIQTIRRLDAEIGGRPAPPPVESGSTRWRFSFFGNKGFTGKGIYSLFIASLELQDSMNFDIIENFSSGSLLAGFKGQTTGTFTTPRKALASEFSSAACNLSLVKVPLQPFLQGSMRVGTVGSDDRRLSVLLQMPSIRDETFGTTVTTGDFQMQGQARTR